MKNEQPGILPGDENKIDDQKLMDYVNDTLSKEETLEIARMVEGSEILKEAVNGLKQFKDAANLPVFVHQLNAALHKQLQKPGQRRHKRKLKNEIWIFAAVFLILILVIVGFIIIRERLRG